PLRSTAGGGCWVEIIVPGEVKREGCGGPKGFRHVEQEEEDRERQNGYCKEKRRTAGEVKRESKG
ncbi:hypothetical protein KUCAC02_030690, partial [Chaenocephalus aceratus]